MSGLAGYSPLEMQRMITQQSAEPQRQDGSIKGGKYHVLPSHQQKEPEMDVIQSLSQETQAKMNAANPYQNTAAQAVPERPAGSLTQRIRSLAGCAEEHEFRLRNLLRGLRVPPPEPNTGLGGAINAVRTTMDEHLQRHENAQRCIDDILAELEGLIG